MQVSWPARGEPYLQLAAAGRDSALCLATPLFCPVIVWLPPLSSAGQSHTGGAVGALVALPPSLQHSNSVNHTERSRDDKDDDLWIEWSAQLHSLLFGK